MYVYAYVCAVVSIPSIHWYMYACMHGLHGYGDHQLARFVYAYGLCMCVHVYVCMYICMYVCMYFFCDVQDLLANDYVCMYVCVH
jgi:hypothetical protein